MPAQELEVCQISTEKNSANVDNHISNINRLQNISISSNEQTPESNLEDTVRRDGYEERVVLCECYQQKKFFKGCKWSPDEAGNRILTCDGDNRLKIFHTFLNKSDYQHSHISNEFYELNGVGKIYDFDWYPTISPSQYFVLTASSLGPIHIWDLQESKCEASYQMYNTKDEMVHAYCVTCSYNGERVYAGTTDYIFIFDVYRPGRICQQIQTRPYFRRGIISAIAQNPARYSMIAAGAYNSRIGIYDEQSLLCLLFGHSKGITYLKFSPDGTLLYSGTRGCGDIFCWDLRNPGIALYKLEREVRTQQRIYFDISADGKHVVSGGTNGEVLIWDTAASSENNILLPIYKFRAHLDCTNGISINKRSPMLTTVSGQYHDNEISYILAESSDESDSEQQHHVENCLKLWHTNWM